MSRIGKKDLLEMLSDDMGYAICRTDDCKYQVIIDSHCGRQNTIVGWITSDLFYELLENDIIESYAHYINQGGEYFDLVR